MFRTGLTDEAPRIQDRTPSVVYIPELCSGPAISGVLGQNARSLVRFPDRRRTRRVLPLRGRRQETVSSHCEEKRLLCRFFEGTSPARPRSTIMVHACVLYILGHFDVERNRLRKTPTRESGSRILMHVNVLTAG